MWKLGFLKSSHIYMFLFALSFNRLFLFLSIVQLADLQSTKNVDLNESEMINEQVVKVSSDLGSNTITDNIKSKLRIVSEL